MMWFALLIGFGFAVLVAGFIAAIVTSVPPERPYDGKLYRIDPEEWRRGRCDHCGWVTARPRPPGNVEEP